jgi:hypothetical protein
MTAYQANLRTLLLASAMLATPTGCLGAPPDDTDGAPPADRTETTEATAEATSALTISGLERVLATSEVSSQWWRSPMVTCNGSNKLIGMGSLQPANGSILFRGLVPHTGDSPYPDRFETSAQEDHDGTSADWSITGYGICGAQPSLMSLHSTTGAASSATRHVQTVNCPSGTRVIGAGGTILDGEGRVKIDEIAPSAALDQVTVTASEDQDGTSESWSVRAYAVCSLAPSGLVRVTAVTPNGWDGTSVIARCPSGKRLLGLGGGVSATDLHALRVYGLIPSSSLTSATTRAITKGSTAGVTGEVRSYAICADE